MPPGCTLSISPGCPGNGLSWTGCWLRLYLGPGKGLLVLTHFTDPRLSESRVFHLLICVQLSFFLRCITPFFLAGLFAAALFPAGSLHKGFFKVTKHQGLPQHGTASRAGTTFLWELGCCGDDFTSEFVFVRAGAVFVFPRRLQTQLKCIKLLKRQHRSQ